MADQCVRKYYKEGLVCYALFTEKKSLLAIYIHVVINSLDIFCTVIVGFVWIKHYLDLLQIWSSTFFIYVYSTVSDPNVNFVAYYKLTFLNELVILVMFWSTHGVGSLAYFSLMIFGCFTTKIVQWWFLGNSNWRIYTIQSANYKFPIGWFAKYQIAKSQLPVLPYNWKYYLNIVVKTW